MVLLNGTAIPGAKASILAYQANFTGAYIIYLNVTDSLNYTAQSNNATFTVYSQSSVTISPTSVTLYYGQSQTFNASVIGGLAPYTYQWYVNGTAISEATSSSWIFPPTTAGTYNIYLNVTDQSNFIAKSNIATANVETPLTVNIAPTQVEIIIGQNQTFSSSVSGGTPPYIYQWYVNNTAAQGATNSNLIFAPTTAGNYSVYLNVTDTFNFQIQSNIINNITVYDKPSVSINPTSVNMTLGESQQFNSTVVGLAPNSYQWYLNNTAILNATNPTWTFTPNSLGTYIIYLKATYNFNLSIKSNEATGIFTLTPIIENLTVNISGSGITNATGTTTYSQFSNVTVLATPNNGYQLNHWLLNGTNVGTTNPYTINMTNNYNLTAIFSAIDTFTITVSPGANGQITPGTGSVNYGATPVFTDNSFNWLPNT